MEEITLSDSILCIVMYGDDMKNFGKYSPNVVLIKKFLSRILYKMSFLLPNKYLPIKYYGGKIYLNLKESVMMMERAFGVYEYWKTKLFFKIVKENMVCVDVGVNKGYYSLLFAKLMKDKGKVLSFEPDPENCYWFRRSILANKYKCIKLYPYALSDKEGTSVFYRGKKSGSGSFFPSKDTTGEILVVKTRRLDNVLKDEGINKVDIIKIDVQGADLLVLKGAERTLKSENVRLVMDVDVKTSEERVELFNFLRSCGFKIFRIGKELTPIKSIHKGIKDIYATKSDDLSEGRIMEELKG